MDKRKRLGWEGPAGVDELLGSRRGWQGLELIAFTREKL